MPSAIRLSDGVMVFGGESAAITNDDVANVTAAAASRRAFINNIG